MTAPDTLAPLGHRVPLLPALPSELRTPGARVYVHGITPATITGGLDTWGAVVREDDADAPAHIEWDRMTAEPAPALRFTIAREDMQVGPEWSPWGVFGNRPDESSDYQWAHFPTHAEAVAYAAAELRAEGAR